jgi:ubiquinone/menaquinone biosynthesis C-methylase UbiE
MSAPAQTQLPSPSLFFQTINAHQRTAALQAAIELDLFTAVGQAGDAGATAQFVAGQCRASEKGARILCDTMTVLGFLSKSGDRYRLTADAAMFLDRRSPAYIGSCTQFLLSPALTSMFTNLAAAVRKGGTAVDDAGSTAPDHPMWVDFAEGMAPLARMSAELMARLLRAESLGPCKVLDIAAGHGMFGITLARHNPQAEIVAVDWSNVLALAQRNAEAAGLAGRFRTIAGSAFDVEFGAGYDLVLLTNFLHHFDAPTCERLLRKVCAALKPGGRAVTLEFVPNEDRVSPPEAATFSLIMLASTPGGDAYTFAEYEQMFRNAGFSRSELHALPPSFQQVVISTK